MQYSNTSYLWYNATLKHRVNNSHIPQMEQHEPEGRMLFCLGNVTDLLDVTLVYRARPILSLAGSWGRGVGKSKRRGLARWTNVTPSNPLPHSSSPPPIPLCVI